jgi:hypothetical protein
MALRRHAMPLEFTIACFAAPSFHEGSGSVADAASASAETGKKGEDRIANATKSASKMRRVMPEGESFLRHPERGRSAANDHPSKLEAGHASNGSDSYLYGSCSSTFGRYLFWRGQRHLTAIHCALHNNP